MPELIDIKTPDSAKTRTGFDGQAYELVFSDEFDIDNRTFYPGDDPYWEAVDLWYGATADEEWYDPSQITTKGGYLNIVLENVANHGLQYRSGMLQSWNKFCFTRGYIEVSLVLPGNDDSFGYVSTFYCANWVVPDLSPSSGLVCGLWVILGGLGMADQRTACGLIRTSHSGSLLCSIYILYLSFHRYNSCDVGTFPNQTLKDGTGPSAATHSDASKSKYDFKLSVLPGQRVS